MNAPAELTTESPSAARRAQRVPLPLLADPAGYVPCPWPLEGNAGHRAYWIDLFRRHFASLREAEREASLREGQSDAAIAQRCDEAQRLFFCWLDAVEQRPDAFAPLTVLGICWAREDAMEVAGIADAYRLAKRTENDKALALLPALLAQQDALGDHARLLDVMHGVFAGNIFDLGATSTIEMHRRGEMDFSQVRAKLKPRPWRIDDLDAWVDRLDPTRHAPHRAAVLFVDNAGPDILLGMIPLARELLRRGTAVILAANERPSLNDVTHAELRGLIDTVARFDPLIREALADGRLRLIASGNDAPLIDLSAVSPELAQACGAAGVDLVVLEGMGRAVESNFEAAFCCDVLKMCMVKDLGVAGALGAEMFDLIFRFEPAGVQ